VPGRQSVPELGYALAASGTVSANTPRAGPIARAGTAVLVTNQLRQRAGQPWAPVTSSSATCHAGATLFLVTSTRTRLPITWPASRRIPAGGEAGEGAEEEATPSLFHPEVWVEVKHLPAVFSTTSIT
jgi:hypothetical protein